MSAISLVPALVVLYFICATDAPTSAKWWVAGLYGLIFVASFVSGLALIATLLQGVIGVGVALFVVSHRMRNHG